ncbi:MAG TPA: hypothetical protein PJ986_10610 [Gammaproteobacteria bacterium]|nr:hypothetical protein [Gammaproteobacteria bacterium]
MASRCDTESTIERHAFVRVPQVLLERRRQPLAVGAKRGRLLG